MIDRNGKILVLVAGGCLAMVLAGCSAETRQNVLSTIFDGVDTPPPPTRRVRRDLLQEIEELKRELAEAREAAKAGMANTPSEAAPLPIEQSKSWQEASKLLPKDSSGQVDWVQALKAGTIAPRPAIDPKAADQPVLPITVELEPPGQPAFKVVFPHAPHTQLLTCDNCHPVIFQMRKGATPINMGMIYAGQACGLCHGKIAFAVTACGRCHPAMAGGS